MQLANRTSNTTGKLLSHTDALHFEFEGKTFQACSGDSVASALAANDCWVLSRSFKYHRPRGVLTMAGQDANSMVQLPADPNALADCTPVTNGLVVTGQNYRGTLARDKAAFTGRLARFLPVGFYYRGFYRPRGVWNWWARMFRRFAGLGVIDQGYSTSSYDKQYLFCDVLVVGGGPAGMTTACAAAQAGMNVVLVDENPLLGGSLNYARLDADGEKADAVCTGLIQAVAAEPNIRVMTGTTANGWFSDNWIPLVAKHRLYKMRATDVMLCTGVFEQHAVFHNNDLPGVMLGTAAQRLWRLYGVRPGQRAVVLTGNDDGYAVALDLADAGVDVIAVVEMRAHVVASEFSSAVKKHGIRIIAESAVYAAHANRQRDHLARVDVRRIVGQGVCADQGEIIDCDLLCMSAGFMPAYQLACQAGAELAYDDVSARFTITSLPQHLHLAGSVNGSWTIDGACAEARNRVLALLKTSDKNSPDSLGFENNANSTLGNNAKAPSLTYPWPIFAHPKGKEFVDYDEDLQICDILNAVSEGYENVQLVKRYSTCGMGPSQGRHSALPMARLVARATDKTVAQTGVTTSRPPYAAETLAHCAGRSFFPERKSSMHYRHAELGAQWLHAGLWYRPAYYGDPDNSAHVIAAEVKTVRDNVGLVDVSTLGGIDIRGADAGEFLNRIYTMMFTSLAVGRARYALMTNEAGVVIDDGVACRLADDHYYVTATTGGVERVFQTMLKWQAQWRLDIDLANVTSAFCAVNLAGPNARQVLRTLQTDIDLSADEFPYMATRTGQIAGIPARLLRVGFVGELGYEIHVPHQCGEALWDALMEAGASFGIRAFGIEAQRMLRLEKGHVIIGQDTDAMSNPMELDMRWALSKNKPFFVGKRTLDELNARPLTRQLVGFIIQEAGAPVPKESHLVIDADQMVGRVTSAGVSPTLGHTIGLAYVPPVMATAGASLRIRCDNGVMVKAMVVSLPFYDPQSERQAL